MNITKRMTQAVAFTGLSFLMAGSALADYAGTYVVNGSGTASMCSDENDNGSFTFTATLGVTENGLVFAGSGPITVNSDAIVDSGTLSISGNLAMGAFSGAGFNVIGNTGSSASGSLLGGFGTNHFSATFSGSAIDGMYGCNIDGSMRGDRTELDAAETGYGVVALINSLLGTQAVAGFTGSRFGALLGGGGSRSQSVTSLDINDLDNGFNVKGEIGLAAGDAFGIPMGIWANYSHTWADNSNRLIKFDMDRDNLMAGIDVMPTEDIVVGVAIGYEKADIDTDYNGGKQDADGYTIAPYAAWHFADLAGYDLTADITGGRTEVDVDQDRVSGGTVISSNVDARRWFWSGNLNASRAFDSWYMSGRFGVLWTEEDQDGYTESNGNTVADRVSSQNQWSLGMEASYLGMGDWEPYGSLAYERDFNVTNQAVVIPAGFSDPYNDDDDLRGGLGLRYFGSNGLSGSIEWDHVFSRDDYDEDTINLLIRVDM